MDLILSYIFKMGHFVDFLNLEAQMSFLGDYFNDKVWIDLKLADNCVIDLQLAGEMDRKQEVVTVGLNKFQVGSRGIAVANDWLTRPVLCFKHRNQSIEVSSKKLEHL
mgnify:CR=1 FL=1